MRVSIVVKGAKSPGAKGDVPKIYGFVQPLQSAVCTLANAFLDITGHKFWIKHENAPSDIISSHCET